MSAPKFTPGPWVVREALKEWWLPAGTITVHDPKTNASLAAVVTGAGDSRARAALIAAAPDLFAALSDMLAKAGGDRASCGHPYTCSCAFDAAHAALAKARGE